jgi:hypothetical protein
MSEEYREKLKSIGFGLPRRQAVPKVHSHEDDNGITYAYEHYHGDRIDVDVHPNTVEVVMDRQEIAGSSSCGAEPAPVRAVSTGMGF